MKNGRTENSIRNIFFGICNRFVIIIFPFIIRTIIIKTLGEEYLGLNTLFKAILQVLNLADLGFSSAISASLYKPIAENDTKEVSALINLYKNIYKIIGWAILIVGLALTPFISKIINGTPPDDINIYFLWILYLVNTVVSYLLFAYKVSLLNAHQRSDLADKAGIAIRGITSILQILVVIFLKSILLYVFLTILCSVFYNLLCSFICDKRYPQYKCEGKVSAQYQKIIYKNVGALAIHKIGNTVSVSLDSIIISAFLGLSMVAIYGNYNYVISAISMFVTLIYASITASVGNSIVVEDVKKNHSDFKRISILNIWIVGWCTICLICLLQHFVFIWMGEKLLFDIRTLLTLVICFYITHIRKIVLTYKDAAGMWWRDRWKPLVGCTVNLILNIILVKTIGVGGVVISTIVSYLFVELPWETHVLFKYYFKQNERSYYIQLLFYTFKIVFAGVVTYSICNLLPGYGWGYMVSKMLICAVVPNVIFIIFNIRNREFREAIQMARNIMKHVIL